MGCDKTGDHLRQAYQYLEYSDVTVTNEIQDRPHLLKSVLNESTYFHKELGICQLASGPVPTGHCETAVSPYSLHCFSPGSSRIFDIMRFVDDHYSAGGGYQRWASRDSVTKRMLRTRTPENSKGRFR
jgi:hypothetical protein